MRLIVTTAVALPALAAPALAEVRTLAEVHTPDRGDRTAFPVIDAFGGRVVWSDYDATIDAWRLMENAAGVTRALPVEPRRSPFDVDLGPDGRGGTVAVYSRCARGLRLDLPTPQPLRAARYGCDLYSFSFTTGRETAIERVNSRADEYWPSVWGSRIAFVRGFAGRRDPDRTATPYPYLGNRRVYLATAGGALRPVARGATSGGGASVHVRTVSVPALAADGAHWLFTNSGEPEYFGAFARRGPQASPRTKAVAFAHDGDTAYFIDGGPGAEFNPLYQPGGAFALKADDAVAYRRHAAQPAARAPAALSAKKKGPARRKLPPGRGRRAKARGSERVLTPLIGSHPAVL